MLTRAKSSGTSTDSALLESNGAPGIPDIKKDMAGSPLTSVMSPGSSEGVKTQQEEVHLVLRRERVICVFCLSSFAEVWPWRRSPSVQM